LASAPAMERVALLTLCQSVPPFDLAVDLKSLYFQHNVSDPEKACGAAAALEVLAQLNDEPRIKAIAAWVRGMAAQLEGQMELSLALLRDASSLFDMLEDRHASASVQVSLLSALAILGRHADAIACGEAARAVFVEMGDELSAGKIEQNLGGIYFRRDQYREAELLLRSAHQRFLQLDDDKQLAQIENNLAIALTMQHRIREAASLYEQALARAARLGMDVTQAEIEDDLGQLALNQGRYDRALDYLERARRRFEGLGMRHAAASAEKQLADAYLELNLTPESITAFEQAIAVFRELGMQAELAAALSNCGRAHALVGERESARTLLAEAGRLYMAEDNEVGRATVTLAAAQISYEQGSFEDAETAAALAEAPFANAGTWARLLRARWLRGDSLRELGQTRAAGRLLRETLRAAETRGVPHIAQRCETSLGLLAAAAGDRPIAEASFKRAVELAEDLRAPLRAEEFRTAFLADKLVAYSELVRLCLADTSRDRATEALQYVERSRSRALLDLLEGDLPVRLHARDAFEVALLERVASLREELNWLYSQINGVSDREPHVTEERVAELHLAVRDRERDVQDSLRQLQNLAGGSSSLVRVDLAPLADLQQDLGTDTAVVEYFVLDDEILAFVITDTSVEVARHIATRQEVQAALGQLQFQMGSLRSGSERVRAHLDQLSRRARHYLTELHKLLLAPVEERLGVRRLVVVPHQALHYVPFHALFDGATYTIERREVCYAPSASVLHQCLRGERLPLQHALLVGVADEQIPRVHDEVAALSGLFADAVTLTGAEATRAALRENLPRADLLHLACHGKFRPDNPLFSALRLGDGWLTVRELYELELDGKLVTLSACETGASAVAPGDELIGLVRGCMSAGAPSLVVSLWAVDDEATAQLMADMYSRLRAGDGPAAALRAAQRRALEQHEHPFFWAPFAVFGRW
jgi:CHAT domain-containing protein/tetratricopeptide (TPR) repeat protein